MRISLEVIHEQLMGKYPQLLCRIPAEAAGTEYLFPTLCRPGHKISPNQLYILSEKGQKCLSQNAPNTAVISIGMPPEDHIGACLIFPSGTSELEAYSAVCKVYDSFSCLYSSLECCLQYSASLQGLVVAIGQWTKNPVTICDESHIVLAHYTRDKNYRPYSGNSPLIGKPLPMSWLPAPKEKDVLLERPVCTSSIIGGQECKSYFQYICYEDRPIAVISISSYEAPLLETDRFLLKIAAPFVKRAVPDNKAINGISLFSTQHAFRSILQDSVPDKRSIKRCLHQNDMKSTDRYACIAMQLNWTWDIKIPVDYICSQIQKALKRGCCFKHDSNLVAFTNLNVLSEEVETVVERLQTVLTKFNLKAGVSNVFTDVFQAAVYCTQALAALECGNTAASKERVYYFNDYALDYLLRYGTSRLSARNICAYRLLRLEESDRENNTEYINTLRAFFDNEMSPTKAAQALYIHRTTFLYRLDRIQNVFGLDWSTPGKRLYLMLSLELL